MKLFLVKKNYTHFLLLVALISICYSNSLKNSWHLDDPQNITENPAIHLSNLHPENLLKTFFAHPSIDEKLFRPVASLSFSLNWYFGQNDPFGYHVINVIVHILTALFLYKTTILLLQSPRLKRRTTEEIFFIALLGVTLWSINPIQTQAVTYIVQRMASMGAMFFILALYHYSYTRLAAKSTQQRLLHLFLCGVFFLLALGCKENTITLIPTILLTELLLFERNDKFSQSIFSLILITNLILLVVASYFIYRQGYLNSFILPYGNRPFSIAERLLTQPSILLFYLSLLLFPNPSRLSIDHSFPVSTSIWAPWTTLPAIVCIVFLLTLGFFFRKKAPLVSFAILFYFINHLIESTIIPLEMIFEHRNYLPSMFLFPVLAYGLNHILLFTSNRLRLVHATLVTVIPILLIANGLGTYSRNLVWASEESLWADALKKAPDNARSWAKLGIIYGWNKEKSSENLRKSVALLQKASELNFPNVKFKAALLDNIGKTYARYGLYDDSIHYFEKSLEINNKFIMARIDLVDSLQKKGKFDTALNEINTILSTENINQRFHLIKSTILLWLNKPVEAMKSSRNYILESTSNKKLGYYLLGTSLTKAGYYERGRWFLQLAKKDRPTDIRITLSLLENYALSDRQDDAKKLAQVLLSTYDLPEVINMLQILENEYHSIPINIGIIAPFIIESAQEYLLNISDHQ